MKIYESSFNVDSILEQRFNMHKSYKDAISYKFGKIISEVKEHFNIKYYKSLKISDMALRDIIKSKLLVKDAFELIHDLQKLRQKYLSEIYRIESIKYKITVELIEGNDDE